MKTKTIIRTMTTLFLTSLILLGCINAAGAKVTGELFQGYNTERGKWVNANLGKKYYEGDWVSYQLRIGRTSKVWDLPEFDIKYNFYQPNTDAVYIDGFDTSVDTGFQWWDGAVHPMLADGTEVPPPGWGTHIPTPEAGETAGATNIINFMEPLESETPETPSEFRYFTVEGIPWGTVTGDYIVLFFRAHLALHIIWSIGAEGTLPPELDGNEFEGWTAAHSGSSFATGSSRHFWLMIGGVGGKAVPIPIVEYPETLINGHKYVAGALFDGWEITLHGELSLDTLPTIPYDPPAVYTGMGVFRNGTPWPTGYFEFTGLIKGRYTLTEESRVGIFHDRIEVTGDATDIVYDEDTVSFDLDRGESATVDFYNILESTTTTELLGPDPFLLGDSVVDVATVTGPGAPFPDPTGTVTFYVGPSIAGPWTQVGAAKALVGGQATSDPYMPLSAGTYYFYAHYSGNDNYLPSDSDPETERLDVDRVPPEVVTLLSDATITLGDSVTDVAIVTGLGAPFPGPTGTVTFYVGPSTTGPWTQVGAVRNLVAGEATSDPYMPLAAGTYYFYAHYSGDSNYLPWDSDPETERLDVDRAPPEVVTELSAITITLGDSVTDVAFVTGLGAPFPDPSGTVTFYVGPSTTGPWTQVGAVKNLIGGQATSDPYMPLAAGTYYFYAHYSGDSNYLPWDSDPETERLDVDRAPPEVITELSATTITLGDSVTDIATVTGLGAPFPDPTGTVTFYVGPSTTGPWTQVGAVRNLVAGEATSDPYMPLEAGTYYFYAHYSGDSNYLPWDSDPETERLDVDRAPPEVTTELSATTILLGDPVTDVAIVTGLGAPFPDPTGTVTFYVGPSIAGPWTQVGAVKDLVAGQATSDAYTPLAAGTYYFYAHYSGDSNYLPWDSDPETERLDVVSPYAATFGYWKNHPEEWVDLDPDALFPDTSYTYMEILWMSSDGDASIILAKQYIAAVLNRNAFGVPTAIEDAISQAETWLATYPPGSAPEDPDRADMVALAGFLEDYNSGGIHPP